jgi:hypothetical protein
MAAPFVGGCLCGAVRYRCTAEPAMSGFCHCRDCQRAGGGPYNAALFVSEDAFSIVSGRPECYESRSDSGNTARRYFCSTCGSQLYSKTPAYPGMVGVRAASLDDPSWFQPMAHIFTSSAQPWVSLSDELPKFEKMS